MESVFINNESSIISPRALSFSLGGVATVGTHQMVPVL